MKIRIGFVSNSSSSSYVCDVCGENVSGMDLGLSEAEMTECKEGHTFCDEHMGRELKSSISLEDKKRKALEYLDDDPHMEDTIEDIKNNEEDIINDIYEEYLYENDSRYEWPVEQCPCCQLVSPTDTQVLCYLLYKQGSTLEEMKKTMKDVFGTWQNFKKETK